MEQNQLYRLQMDQFECPRLPSTLEAPSLLSFPETRVQPLRKAQIVRILSDISSVVMSHHKRNSALVMRPLLSFVSPIQYSAKR